MSAQVIQFPQRQVEGQTWEPWTDERRVAEFFGVTDRTVRRWRDLGMPSVKFGGVRRFRLSECERWNRERGAA